MADGLDAWVTASGADGGASGSLTVESFQRMVDSLTEQMSWARVPQPHVVSPTALERGDEWLRCASCGCIIHSSSPGTCYYARVKPEP